MTDEREFPEGVFPMAPNQMTTEQQILISVTKAETIITTLQREAKELRDALTKEVKDLKDTQRRDMTELKKAQETVLTDHESRLRRIERNQYVVFGGATAVGWLLNWLTSHLPHLIH